MKGKKINIEFMDQFISECVQNQQNTIPQICWEAQNRISQLDEQLRQIESIKSERSSYRDIVRFFDQHSDQEEQWLKFFKLSNKQKAFDLCRQVKKNKQLSLDDQLIQEMKTLNIIKVEDGQVKKSNHFDDFYHFFEMFYAQ